MAANDRQLVKGLKTRPTGINLLAELMVNDDNLAAARDAFPDSLDPLTECMKLMIDTLKPFVPTAEQPPLKDIVIATVPNGFDGTTNMTLLDPEVARAAHRAFIAALSATVKGISFKHFPSARSKIAQILRDEAARRGVIETVQAVQGEHDCAQDDEGLYVCKLLATRFVVFWCSPTPAPEVGSSFLAPLNTAKSVSSKGSLFPELTAEEAKTLDTAFRASKTIRKLITDLNWAPRFQFALDGKEEPAAAVGSRNDSMEQLKQHAAAAYARKLALQVGSSQRAATQAAGVDETKGAVAAGASEEQ
jgi:hypothetical protein